MVALRGVTRGFALFKTVVLARILVPSQFGIYGIATLVLGFLEMLTETGINIFLIQEKDKTDEYLDSAWVVSILRGILISLGIIIFIPLIITFFNSPGTRGILILVAIVPLIRGFINPAVVKFQKNLEFNKQFYYDSALFSIDAFVAVFVGIMTKSENSLIWGMIAASLVEVIFSFVIFKSRPKFVLNKEKVLKVINRGKWITGAGLFNYLFQHLDDIFVGKILGTSSLGIYQQAYRISSLPVSEVGEVFNKVTFPIYVSIENDKQRLKKAFLKTLIAVIFFVVPFGLLIFCFPKTIVGIVLGENWYPAIPIIKLLAIFGVVKAIANSFFSLFLGIGKQEIVMLTTLVASVVMALIIIPLINSFGVLGAGYAAVLSTVFSLPVPFYFIWKYLK